MRHVAIIISMLVAPSMSWGDDFSFGAQDKQLHMAASFGATVALTQAFKKWGFKQPQLTAAVVVLSLGLAKEACDEQFSGADMLANSIGTTLGVGWSFAF